MKQEIHFPIGPTLVFFLLSYFIQTQLALSGDVGYLLHAANLLLSGGHYGTQIFETNPPLILYLYAPVCMIVNYTSFSWVVTVRLYVLLLVLISMALNFMLLKKLVPQEKSFLIHSLFYTLLFVFLILPANAFAQREHLLLILIMPYLLLAALFLQKKSVSSFLAISIGVGAGFGFALKPYFLLIPSIIESALIFKHRHWKAGFRPETFAIATLILLYLGSIFIWQREYVEIVLPFVFHYYFPFVKQPWPLFFSPPYVMFCLGVAFSYLYFYRYDRSPNVGTLFFLALIGCAGAFLMERTSWYYHVFPALGLAYLLAVHCTAQLFLSNEPKRSHPVIVLIAGFCIFGVPLYNEYCMLEYGITARKDHYKQQIIRYINTSPGDHSMVCLPIGTMDCFPLVYLTQGHYASRFPSLWWYKGTYFDEHHHLLTPEVGQDKKYLIESLVADLDQYSVQWVIMNRDIFKTNDVIAYLKTDPLFDAYWQAHYHAAAHFGPYQIYERNQAGLAHEIH